MQLTKRRLIQLTASGLILSACSGGGTGSISSSVTTPSANSGGASSSKTAIVIGAGMSGLKAARDLTAQGISTIILEGQDRIGGGAVVTITLPSEASNS